MKILIFGLGAIGSNLFISLLRQFPDWEFVGIDFDVIESRNIRTQVYFKDHIGIAKANALSVLGNRYVNKLKYTPYKLKVVSTTNIFQDGDLWIDCFDNSLSRSVLKELVKKTNASLLHLGFSPLYSAECIWDAHYDVPGDVDTKQADICSMTDAVGFIQMFVGLATMNISSWSQTKEQRDFIVTHKTKLIEL